MRKARWIFTAVAFLAAVVALGAAQRAPSPSYEFDVVRTASGIQLECHHGCDWKTLEGRCDPEFPDCTYRITERGIRVFPDPAGTDGD